MTRRIAIVCHPTDSVALQSGHSIPIIAYQLARCLPQNWRSTLYGRRWPGQKRRETDGDTIEFKRVSVFYKLNWLLQILSGILGSYTQIRIRYHMQYYYHIFYALRIALNIRASKFNVVLVFNFPQFASIIKLINPSATLCLYMQCEWLTQFATAASERKLRDIDLIVTCSDYITGTIRSRFPEIAARCHTLYNAVDTDSFHPPRDVSMPSYNADRLLYVGRISPEKGVHVLIRAFKIVAESRPGLQLHIVGNATLMPYLFLWPDRKDQAIASLEAFYGKTLFDMVRRQLFLRAKGYLADLAGEIAGDDRIVFQGAVLHPGLIELYHRAAMLVFPSVWNEPFGMPTAEAMACGLPVVSTCSGGIPEIVEDGRTGLLVARDDVGELARGIRQLIDDPARARAMGEAGRQRVLQRFTWDTSARHLIDLIEGVPFNQHSLDEARALKSPISIRT